VISIGSMEPVDGGQVGGEPVIGWRVWGLTNNRLISIAKGAFWEPGENQAQCLAGYKHDVPAPSCHCGFWALNNPVPTMHLAVSHHYPPRPAAVGLIRGYGAIAVHGREGFRAGLASVVCIFSDAPEPLVMEPGDARRRVAEEYGVPCITLERAISIGFLREMGVGSDAIDRLEGWILAGRPLPSAQLPPRLPISVSPPRPEGAGTELTQRERQIAWLVAQGMTNVEIARSMSLNSRTVAFHVYRIVEKTGSRHRADLARWVA
jgi:DNA-binding CsgD family transcriptional regulator